MRARSRTRLALALVVALAAPGAALAETITVDSTANNAVPGDGFCTLREAVANANGDTDSSGHDCLAGSGADVIEIPAGTYLLSGALTLTAPVTLHGAGADQTKLEGAGVVGLLVLQPSAGAVSIENMTLDGAAGAGAISNLGATLTITRSILSGSTGTEAGALTNHSGSATIRQSLIRDNRGPTSCGLFSAGAISVFAGAVRIENSTLSGNQGRCGQGAAVAHVGSGTLSLAYSTVAYNPCTATCPALTNDGTAEAVQLRATLLYNSTISNCAAAYSSGGYNLDVDGSCELGDPTDVAPPTLVPPHTFAELLRPLQDNGGVLPTHALVSGNPAIDAIPAEACTIDDDGDAGTPEVALTVDQRAFPRPAAGDSGSCDVGAYEGTYVDEPPVAVCKDVSLPTSGSGCNATANVDDGSSDPKGDTLTKVQTPPGPYGVGANEVTLTVTDPGGNSDTCLATVTVSDAKPPAISCPTASPKAKKGQPLVFGVPATDNCGPPSYSLSDVHCFSIKKGKKGAPDEQIPEACTIVTGSSGVQVTQLPKKKSHMVWTVDAEDVNGNAAAKTCDTILK